MYWNPFLLEQVGVVPRITLGKGLVCIYILVCLDTGGWIYKYICTHLMDVDMDGSMIICSCGFVEAFFLQCSLYIALHTLVCVRWGLWVCLDVAWGLIMTALFFHVLSGKIHSNSVVRQSQGHKLQQRGKTRPISSHNHPHQPVLMLSVLFFSFQHLE